MSTNTTKKFVCSACHAETDEVSYSYGIHPAGMLAGEFVAVDALHDASQPGASASGFDAYHKCAEGALSGVTVNGAIDPATDFKKSPAPNLGILGSAPMSVGGLGTSLPPGMAAGYAEGILGGGDPTKALLNVAVPEMVRMIEGQNSRNAAGANADRACEAANWLDAAERAKKLGQPALHKKAMLNAEAAINFRKSAKKK